MEIDKKELKKISRKFRSTASRVINAHFEEINSLITMFVRQIDQTPLIIDYIRSVLVVNDKIEQEMLNLASEHDETGISTGLTVDEEVSNIYQMLQYIAEHPDFQVWTLGSYYTTSNKFQDMIKCFGEVLVLPFVNHIDQYLLDIATDMGYDENNKFLITVNGGHAQVNIASDYGSVTASQNNNEIYKEIFESIQNLRDNIKHDAIEIEIKEQIEDALSGIQAELETEKPKKSVLKALAGTLRRIALDIPAYIAAVEGIRKICEYLGPLLS
jgi:uncharacterized membrane protein YheB (UPF0754 family)